MKSFQFERHQFDIPPPSQVSFEHKTSKLIYARLFNEIQGPNACAQIDADTLIKENFFGKYRAEGVHLQSANSGNPNSARWNNQTALQHFFESHPIFITFIQNCRLLGGLQLKHAQELMNSACKLDNFMDLKRICNQFYKQNWTRDQDSSESQASNTNLGHLSESLLKEAFSSILRENVFEKVGKSDARSYGDFVVSALPNNLWLSVKSNFARERLLASGFSNDIVGVGFFEEVKEFTSLVKIRHFQRAGFLAIYLPDEPVTIKQIDEGINTFESVEEHYAQSSKTLPTNINGKPFLRALSQLPADLESVIKHKSLRQRLTVNF